MGQGGRSAALNRLPVAQAVPSFAPSPAPSHCTPLPDPGPCRRPLHALERFPDDFTPLAVSKRASEEARDNFRAFVVRSLNELYTGKSEFGLKTSAYADVAPSVLQELAPLGWRYSFHREGDALVVRFPPVSDIAGLSSSVPPVASTMLAAPICGGEGDVPK